MPEQIEHIPTINWFDMQVLEESLAYGEVSAALAIDPLGNRFFGTRFIDGNITFIVIRKYTRAMVLKKQWQGVIQGEPHNADHIHYKDEGKPKIDDFAIAGDDNTHDLVIFAVGHNLDAIRQNPGAIGVLPFIWNA